jgi:hypothetical protein
MAFLDRTARSFLLAELVLALPFALGWRMGPVSRALAATLAAEAVTCWPLWRAWPNPFYAAFQPKQDLARFLSVKPSAGLGRDLADVFTQAREHKTTAEHRKEEVARSGRPQGVRVHAGDKIQGLIQQIILPQIARSHRAPVNIVDHQCPCLVMKNCRRDPRRKGRLAGGKLVKAQDVMHRNVIAHPHHSALGPVLHQKIVIGDATAQRCGADRPAPARQGFDLFQRCHDGPSLRHLGVG